MSMVLFFNNPIFGVLKGINIPYDILYIILSYDSSIFYRVLNIKYIQQMFTNLKSISIYNEFFSDNKEKIDYNLTKLIRKGSAKINWQRIEENIENYLNIDQIPPGNIYGLDITHDNTKVNIVTRKYQLSRKSDIISELKEKNLNKYNYSRLQFEFIKKYNFKYNDDNHDAFLEEYIQKRENKKKILHNSKISYARRKLLNAFNEMLLSRMQ